MLGRCPHHDPRSSRDHDRTGQRNDRGRWSDAGASRLSAPRRARTTRRARARAGRRLVAGGQLPRRRSALPDAEPAAARAPRPRADQAAAPRTLRDGARTQPALGAPQPGDPATGPRRAVRGGPRTRRAWAERLRVARGHGRGAVHRGRRGTRPAWRRSSGGSPFPAASRATALPRPRVRCTKGASSATRCCTPTVRCSTTRTSSPAAWSGTARPRPVRWPRAGLPIGSSTPRGTVPSCPILALNGYKIANPTVLARIPEDELVSMLRGLRVRASPGVGRRPLTRASAAGRRARRMHRRHRGDPSCRAGERPAVRGVAEGADDRAAHAEGLDLPAGRRRGAGRGHVPRPSGAAGKGPRGPRHLEVLGEWLRSYRPEELFADEGGPSDLSLVECARGATGG